MDLAAHDTDKNIYMDEKRVDEMRGDLKLLRLVFRSILGHLHDFDLATRVPFSQLRRVDKIVLVKLSELLNETAEHYERMETAAVVERAREFLLQLVGDFYLDFVKSRLVTRAESRARVSAQYVLNYVL